MTTQRTAICIGFSRTAKPLLGEEIRSTRDRVSHVHLTEVDDDPDFGSLQLMEVDNIDTVPEFHSTSFSRFVVPGIDRFCCLVVRVHGYRTELYCVYCEVRNEFMHVMQKKVDCLCGLVHRVPGYRTETYCVSCEVRTEFIYVMQKKVYCLCGLVVRVPGYRTDLYCVFCEVRTKFTCVM
jgi:hypothetical protein